MIQVLASLDLCFMIKWRALAFLNYSRKATVYQSVLFGLQLTLRRCFHRRFTFEVNDHRQLLRLLACMVEHLHKALNDPIEGIVVIVVNDQLGFMPDIRIILNNDFFEFLSSGKVQLIYHSDHV